MHLELRVVWQCLDVVDRLALTQMCIGVECNGWSLVLCGRIGR